MDNPFPYQGPLDPRQVHGRDELLADLTERVTARRVTALLGPRRYGKTSVLRRLAADLTEVTTVAVDLFGVQTHADLVARLSTALAEAPASVRDPAVDVAVEFGFDLAGVRASIQVSPRRLPDPAILYSNLVRTIVRVSQRTAVLLIFDEFQSIDAVPGAAATLRTQLQTRYTELGLVFAGSQPSAMRDIFTRHDQPFFNQADVVEIGPLPHAAVVGIVGHGFRGTGRDPGTVAGQIFGLTAGHPQRTMRAAAEVWRHTEPGDRADRQWAPSLQALRDAEAATLAAQYADLTGSEQKVMRVFANGGAIFGAAAKRLGLGAGAADHARQRLLADGKLITTDEERVTVTDPLLADWLRAHLPL